MEKIQTAITDVSDASLVIICKGKILSLDLDDVTHVSKFGNEIVIYTASNAYRTCHSLQEIFNVLPADKFFRIHRSHIISLGRMDGVRKNRAKIGDHYLPLSDYYRVRLCAWLQSLLNESCEFRTVGNANRQ